MMRAEAMLETAMRGCAEQCLTFLLEARARECIGVASRKAQRKREHAALRGARYENAQVTFIRPEAIVNYARPRRS